MAETELRANSLRVSFERGVPEPTDSEIFRFMKSKMNLKSDKLLSMYKDKSEMSVIIKFKKEEDMRNVLCDLPGTLLFEYNKYEHTEVKLTSANAIVRYVRLFNLPPEIDDREISVVMQRFGKVVRMIREKYGEETGFPIWTSVRGVYLELKEGIEVPATVFIRNVRARVFYEGIITKCYHCGSREHLKAECPERKTVNDRLLEHQGTSYSGILKSGEKWLKRHHGQGDNTNTQGMTILGQILTQRSTPAHQRLTEGEPSDGGVVQESKNDCGSGGQTSTSVGNEPEVESTRVAEGNDDSAAVTENEFIKVTGKRGRKQQKATEGTSDSDEPPLERVHHEQKAFTGTKGSTLSEKLDRVTRSKSKQMKVSANEDSSSTGGDVRTGMELCNE